MPNIDKPPTDPPKNDKKPPEGPPQGKDTPPVDNPPDEDSKINELIQKQMKAFQEELKKQLDDKYNDKLSKLQDSQKELEEKKQRLLVLDELKAANMDSSLVDFVYDKDIEISKIKIKQLNDLVKIEVQKGIEERLRATAYIPPTSSGDMDFHDNKPKPKYFI